MKVQELIEILQGFDPNAPVFISDIDCYERVRYAEEVEGIRDGWESDDSNQPVYVDGVLIG